MHKVRLLEINVSGSLMNSEHQRGCTRLVNCLYLAPFYKVCGQSLCASPPQALYCCKDHKASTSLIYIGVIEGLLHKACELTLPSTFPQGLCYPVPFHKPCIVLRIIRRPQPYLSDNSVSGSLIYTVVQRGCTRLVNCRFPEPL